MSLMQCIAIVTRFQFECPIHLTKPEKYSKSGVCHFWIFSPSPLQYLTLLKQMPDAIATLTQIPLPLEILLSIHTPAQPMPSPLATVTIFCAVYNLLFSLIRYPFFPPLLFTIHY